MSNKVYDVVTADILKQLEEGTVPWHKPWKDGGLPKSMATSKPYRGVNVFLLGMANYSSPWWGTYRNIEEHGGQVRKGEHGTLVIFWKRLTVADDKSPDPDATKQIPMLRYFKVFNAEQADWPNGLPTRWTVADDDGAEVEPIDACEMIVDGYLAAGGPTLAWGTNGAWYQPAQDHVGMPARDQFMDAAEMYSTLFHELTHSTGHGKRLAREGITRSFHRFGDPIYSREELVAEMGAAMLCGVTGIENRTIGNSAAYIANWVKMLKGDAKLVVQAAGLAQRAADMIQGVKWGEVTA